MKYNKLKQPWIFSALNFKLSTHLLHYFCFPQWEQDFKSLSLTFLVQALLPQLTRCFTLAKSW